MVLLIIKLSVSFKTKEIFSLIDSINEQRLIFQGASAYRGRDKNKMMMLGPFGDSNQQDVDSMMSHGGGNGSVNFNFPSKMISTTIQELYVPNEVPFNLTYSLIPTTLIDPSTSVRNSSQISFWLSQFFHIHQTK